MRRSRVSLEAWYELLWWFAYEFTAHKTAREIGGSQKKVYRCFRLIRQTLYDYEAAEMKRFMGEVEVDETYVGPKFRNRRCKVRQKLRKINAVKRGRGAKHLQQPIFGIYQRNGVVYVEGVADVGTQTLQDIIRGRITLASNVYSDTMWSYYGLDRQGYCHETVDHGKQEYMKRKQGRSVHINGIEGFWGYMKERLLKHHGVKRSQLMLYVKEIEFRFNHRTLTTDELVDKLIHILLKSAPSRA